MKRRRLDSLPRATAYLALSGALGAAAIAHGDGNTTVAGSPGPRSAGLHPGGADMDPVRSHSMSRHAHDNDPPEVAKIPDDPAQPLSPMESLRVNTLRSRLAELDRREAELAAQSLAISAQAETLMAEAAKLAALRTAWSATQAEFEGHLAAACGERVEVERERGLERAKQAERACLLSRDEAEARVAETERAQAAEERRKVVEQHEADRAAEAAAAKKTDDDASRNAASEATAAAQGAKDAETQRLAAEKEQAERVNQLAKILKGMRAEDSARLIAEQSDTTALAVLATLGDRASAKILAKMRPDRSSLLAKRLVEGAPPVKP